MKGLCVVGAHATADDGMDELNVVGGSSKTKPVKGVGFEGWSWGFRVKGAGFRVRVQGLGWRVPGLGFGV